jgi:hypothetical protein
MQADRPLGEFMGGNLSRLQLVAVVFGQLLIGAWLTLLWASRLSSVLVSFLISGMRDELPFRVELWDEGFNRLLETLAAAGDYLTVAPASRLCSGIELE